MDEQKKKFLENELFSFTVMATVQRSKTYRDEAKESEKDTFKAALQKQLTKLSQQYTSNVGEEVHIHNIERLAEDLSKEFGSVLEGGHFRIGSAQKALNLYLKYLWCLGEITIPPHCPFDNIIIGKLSGCNSISWTKLDDIKDYRCLVEAARAKAGNMPIAQWELNIYNSA